MVMSSEYAFLSDLEKKVYNWLTKNDIPFTTQQRMFGTAGEVGSAVIDFILGERNIALRVMGSYWHSTLEAKARDEFGREQLVNQGYIIVDLHEENLTDDRINRTMELAIEGQESLR